MTNERFMSYQESIPDASYVLMFFWYSPGCYVTGVTIGRCDADGGWRIGVFQNPGQDMALTLYTARDMDDALEMFESTAFSLMQDKPMRLSTAGRSRCRSGRRLK